ncbi:Hypothetical predicted protein [Xyrichtys novacula]|uniref:Uncharacterized protein n=1 Tax=Xyrichtys novacula TaxID=13765 RepID=A0AAV1F5D6_XYRNO|nr:Hypothetical predicted protein [Xyrichtys novacula]
MQHRRFSAVIFLSIHQKIEIISKTQLCITMFNLSMCFVIFKTEILSIFSLPCRHSEEYTLQTSRQCETETWENFSLPAAIDSSNKKAPTWMHLLACCRDQVFWQELLEAAIEDLSSQNPNATPSSYHALPVRMPSITATS